MSALHAPSLRTRLLAGGALVVGLAVAGVAMTNPFSGSTPARASSIDNGSPTSTRRVERTTLTSQTQVSGTLGYAGSWTVAVPAATSQTDLQQAQQQLTTARSGLPAAQAAVSADHQAITQATATLRAAQLKESSDCAGANAAGSGGSGSGSGSGSGTDASPCASAMQAVSADQAALTSAEQKEAMDGAQLTGARATLASAQQAASEAESAASPYGGSASYTMLPAPGKVVLRGEPLYAVDGQPALLLYGRAPAWRAFRAGMSAGADVAELNANLAALGYGAPSGDVFTAATTAAIDALQRARGLAETGSLLLGAVVFEPGPARVTAVTPTLGQAVQPGAVLTASSTRQDVAIQLDASQQGEVNVGDRVSVTLPDNSTTPGVVTSVGKVATAPAPASDQSQGGGSSAPTITVDVRLLHAGVAGHLDQAPVNVSITTATVKDALVVPVDALVALAGGGYAVEEVEATGLHQLVAVTPGLFDDAAGLVQITGSGLAVGQRVVVPAG